MYEVAVRDVPARSLLCLLRHVHADQQIPVGREFLIRPDAGRVGTKARGYAGGAVRDLSR